MKTVSIIDEIIEREGSTFTDRRADRGGPTKYGITQQTLTEWRNKKVTARDVAELTEKEARQIYEARYIKLPGFIKIKDDRVRAALVDWGVNSGPMTAIKYAQRLVGERPDGVIGQLTEKAINRADPVKLALRINMTRLRFCGRIVAEDPHLHLAIEDGHTRLQAENISGWINRITKIVEESL